MNENRHESKHEESRRTLGIILRGDSESLDRVLRLLRTLRGVSLVFARKTQQRLWIIDHAHMTGRRKRRHARHARGKQVRGKDGRVVIGDEIYRLDYIRSVEEAWQQEGILR